MSFGLNKNPFANNGKKLVEKKEEPVQEISLEDKNWSEKEIEAELFQLAEFTRQQVRPLARQSVDVINLFTSTYTLKHSTEVALGHIDSENKKVLLNMNAFMRYSRAERATIYEHLKWHVVLLHELRAKKFTASKDKFELACDIAVNNLLASEGFKMPKGFPTWKEEEGKTAEQIFQKLPNIPPLPSMSSGQGQSQGGNGSQSQSSQNNEQQEQSDASNSDSSGNSGKNLTNNSLNNANNLLKSSGVDFNGGNGVEDNPLRSDFGAINDPLTEQVLKEQVGGLGQRLKQIADGLNKNNAERKFSPFGIADELLKLEKFVKPVVDWVSVLRNQVKEKIEKPQKSYSLLNRRTGAFKNLRLKGRKAKFGIPTMHIGFDVSGSITREDQIKYLSEINAIALDNNTEELILGTFNSQVEQVFYLEEEDLENENLLDLEIRIGGGTDPKNLISYFNGDLEFEDELVSQKAKFAIFFTDMEFYMPSEDIRDYPIIWVCVNNPYFAPSADQFSERLGDSFISINKEEVDFL